MARLLAAKALKQLETEPLVDETRWNTEGKKAQKKN